MSQNNELGKTSSVLSIEVAEGYVTACSINCALTKAARNSAKELLQRRPEISAAILSHSELGDLFAEAFQTAWTKRPPRLASLAAKPHEQVCVVARATDDIVRSVELIRDVPFGLWRWLVDLAKHGVVSEFLPVTERQLLGTPNDTQPSDFGEQRLPQLLSVPPLHELDWLFSELSLVRLTDLCGAIVSPADATAVLSGLWLLHGDSDRSHHHSQSIEDEGRHRSGNFWHGILHRQEPDYGNSKYWFRRVGRHPVYEPLARKVSQLIRADGSTSAQQWGNKLGLPGSWDPLAFVDWCEAVASDGASPLADLARKIQFIEMHLLLLASFEDAVGSSC